MAKNNATASMANVLMNIASEYDKVENVASGILKVLKDEGIEDLEGFNTLMSAAYKANGWQQGGGRPAKSGEVTPIPAAVRVYVSVLRSAYRHDLDVTEYDSISELREDLRKERVRTLGGSTESDIPGVNVTDTGALIGSVFHDLIVVHATLPAEDREALENSLERLLRKYSKGTKLPTKQPRQRPQIQPEQRLH